MELYNATVGAHKWAIHILEKFINHPPHYFTCHFHVNELPFRILSEYYDGKHEGPFGMVLLQNLLKKQCQAYQLENSSFSSLIKFRNYQKISLRLKLGSEIFFIESVINREVSEDLAIIEPGQACVSQWNTLWSLILRICIWTKKPFLAATKLSNIMGKI